MSLGMRQPAGALQGTGEPSDLTVLVVDDEPGVRAIGGRVLKNGCRVLEAADGLRALEMAAQHPGPIHPLVTDLELPCLDGHELHHRLNHQRPETRTIFMSGYSATGLQPSDAFLSKPFCAQALLLKVCEALQILDLGRKGTCG